MNTIPTLNTPRLLLRPLDRDCQAAYEQFYTDAEASRFYSGPLSAAAAFARLQADLGSWYLQGFGVWAIQLKDSLEIVGVCGFWQGLHWPRELTWWLLPSARGKGIAQEASRAAVAHAYDCFGWDTVQTYMNDDNTAARSLVLRLGGQPLGRQLFPDGNERTLYQLPHPGSNN